MSEVWKLHTSVNKFSFYTRRFINSYNKTLDPQEKLTKALCSNENENPKIKKNEKKKVLKYKYQ